MPSDYLSVVRPTSSLQAGDDDKSGRERQSNKKKEEGKKEMRIKGEDKKKKIRNEPGERVVTM